MQFVHSLNEVVYIVCKFLSHAKNILPTAALAAVLT